MIKIKKSQTTRLGFSVDLVYYITQTDEKLLSLPPPPARGEGRGPAGPHRGPPAGSVMNFYKCGNVYKKGATFDFRVTKLDDIVNQIIPFFNKYPIIGVKSKDFKDFSKAAELITHKKHLIKPGLDQISKIKAGMNSPLPPPQPPPRMKIWGEGTSGAP